MYIRKPGFLMFGHIIILISGSPFTHVLNFVNSCDSKVFNHNLLYSKHL